MIVALRRYVLLSSLLLSPVLRMLPAQSSASVEGAPSAGSYSARVAAFWADFVEHAEKLHGMVGVEGEQEKVLAHVVPRVEGLVPGMAWSFAAGSEAGMHALILSPEGSLDRWLLADEWLRHAPRVAGWEFHAGTPPSSIDGHTVRIDDQVVALDGCHFVLRADKEAQRVGVTVFHEAFAEMPDEVAETIAWLAVSNVLGEQRAFVWLGELRVRKGAPPQRTAASEQLLEQFDAMLRKHEWDPQAQPGQSYVVYESEPEVPPSFPRADVAIGSTSHFDLIGGYGESGGKPDDLLAGTGACHVWIAIPTECFDMAQLVDQRGAIEDAVMAALPSGRVLGAATGKNECCIDLLLFDETRSFAALKTALAGIERVRSARLCHFAGGRAPQVLK